MEHRIHRFLYRHFPLNEDGYRTCKLITSFEETGYNNIIDEIIDFTRKVFGMDTFLIVHRWIRLAGTKFEVRDIWGWTCSYNGNKKIKFR